MAAKKWKNIEKKRTVASAAIHPPLIEVGDFLLEDVKIGNAVPPLLSIAIAESMLKALDEV